MARIELDLAHAYKPQPKTDSDYALIVKLLRDRAALALDPGKEYLVDPGDRSLQASLKSMFGERAVAALAHVSDDGAHRLIDILRRLALGGEKRGEAGGKVGG